MGIQTRHKGLTDAIKTLENLSPRIQRQRDDYFSGVQCQWNNEASAFDSGHLRGIVLDRTPSLWYVSSGLGL